LLVLRLALVGTLSAVLSSAVVSDERTLYRYINEKGVKVIVGSLPPKATPLGYDIITLSGVLIERVPRQLTAAELSNKGNERNQQRLQEEEQRRLEEWDKSLMLRYSSTSDIKAGKDRAMSNVKVRISILKSNRQSVKSEIESEQARAANIERRNGKVPKAMTDKIDVLREEIKSIEDAISVRGQETEDIEKQFVRDVARFETLQERIELRNKARPTVERKSYY
jgi:phosphoenolpyruvate synthase/pyruvate phosphate dikinase